MVSNLLFTHKHTPSVDPIDENNRVTNTIQREEQTVFKSEKKRELRVVWEEMCKRTVKKQLKIHTNK